jgi:hypothetical protein
MRRLVEDGWTPSNAAAAVVAGTAPSPAPAPDRPGSIAPIQLTGRFVDAAAALDLIGLEQVLDEMFASGTFERMAEEQLLPALHALGDAWADGTIDVGAEHAASAAVHRRLAGAFQAAGVTPSQRGAILVGLPPGSRHELGGLAFSVAARRAGLPILYLGPDLPAEDWVATALRTRAGGAVIGAVAPLDASAAAAVARSLLHAAPHLVVAFGGRGAPRDVPGVTVLPEPIEEAVATLAAALGRS